MTKNITASHSILSQKICQYDVIDGIMASVMQNVIYSIIWFFSWVMLVPIFKIFVRFEAIGRENLKEIRKGPAIFISNHECYFDPWIIGMGLPLSRFNLYPVYYMASDKLFKKKLLSLFLVADFASRRLILCEKMIVVIQLISTRKKCLM